MNTSSMKNIVVLKDLPSNIVEEAIIFLKENQKLKRPELVDIDLKKIKENSKNNTETNKKIDGKNSKDYIVNEAQMLIAEYISKLENKDKKENISYKKLKKKYNFLKKVSSFLAIALIISTALIFLLWGKINYYCENI